MDFREKFFQRNLELGIEFSKYILNHPELDQVIPENATIIFLPDYDKELKSFNLDMARRITQDGGKVVYVKIAKFHPENTSRIEGVAIGQENTFSYRGKNR